MTRTEATWSQISTRTILIGALIFNVVAIGLSEVQRRALVDRSDEILTRNVGNRNKTMEDTNRTLAALLRTTTDMQRSLDSLLTIVSADTDQHLLEARIIKQLNDGKQVTILFDRHPSENRDKDGNILCGPEAEAGYLGAFVAGQKYSISYDKATHGWIGTGPSQNYPYDSDTATCRSQTATYGPNQLKQDVAPEAGGLVLWGAKFRFEGLNVFQSGSKVGHIIWFD